MVIDILENSQCLISSKANALELLKAMYLTRFTDDKMSKLVRQNKGGTFHLSVCGHEMIGCAAGMALVPGKDWGLPYYRDRAFAIGLGCELEYIFGAFLVYTGAKIIFAKEEEHSLDTNPVVKFCRKNFGVSNEYHGHALTVLQNGKRVLTMFTLTVITIGTSDVIFAIDSIPAVFAITQNTYIVFTANVFSVLGLRAIFFLIANILHRFYYLKHALSIILAFIGVKMLIVDFYHIYTSHSLIFIVCVFVIAILASVVRKER